MDHYVLDTEPPIKSLPPLFVESFTASRINVTEWNAKNFRAEIIFENEKILFLADLGNNVSSICVFPAVSGPQVNGWGEDSNL
ncbi:hypothetical protein Bpfe_030617 [Biomphalaria pfeifferi]|uniref:Uncharacterized protein n=1 Tax=Biomphalaria pfeifferi TaxID=112525 RepID=A0AAD8AQZ2_BIOPF|nr:hypothetical protein Bpfe_030617 [Biomphalaria pfeifferi]